MIKDSKGGAADPTYWDGRWKRGETGWHQDEVEPNLVQRFDGLGPTRVFVPLCGKSKDLTWLASKGHEVVGVEFSEKACREYFEEQGLKYEESSEGELRKLQAGRVTLWNGDFFKIAPEHLGKLGALYDRAALIALPPDVRVRYAAHMKRLVRACAEPGFKFLQIVLEREPHDVTGPPYSVPAAEVTKLYSDVFRVLPVSREKVEIDREPEGASSFESVFFLEANG